MKPIRSFLFVPANRTTMIDKAVASAADALILDLEDSVPVAEKAAARDLVSSRLGALVSGGRRIYVRINRSPHLYDYADLLAVAKQGVEGIFISKPCGPEDVHIASSMISECEMRNGAAIGSIKLIPLLETARSLELAYQIACIPRGLGS